MWELISSNQRKSIFLFIALGAVLVLLSFLIGKAYIPEADGIGFIFFGLFIWMILALVAYFSGDSILLMSSRARQVTPEINPRLFNVVEEMKIAANLPVMPKIYIIDEQAPNAFAVGKSPASCSIAVTAGLLNRLSRDELQGVIAHEMSHILNRDVLFLTFAGVTLGSISLISYVFLRGFHFRGSSRRYRTSSSGGNQIQIILFVLAIVFAILGPILARILYFSISRRREYLADASAARLTRYPEGLASALEKIAIDDTTLTSANNITAPMYIANPFRHKSASLFGIGRTHPPIEDRIKILRKMSSGAGYNDYQSAYSSVTGAKVNIIPPSALKDKKPVMIKTAGDLQGAAESTKSSKRELGDLLKAINNYVFLTCTCGLKIKIPPDFKDDSITCPRCHRQMAIPVAQLAVATSALTGLDKLSKTDNSVTKPIKENLEFKRTGKGWETFTCTCGRRHNISPAFTADNITCAGCGRLIKVI